MSGLSRDDIIRMAREAGIPETATEGVFIANLDDLGRLIAAEREACAKLCEEWLHSEWHNQGVMAALMIRARGNDAA